MARKTSEELKSICKKFGVNTLWSWSRYHCYKQDKWEYYLKYILHEKEDRTNSIYCVSGGNVHDIIENLYYANSVYVKGKEDYTHIGKRNAYQKRAYVKVKMLLYFALIARENQCILPKQHEQISTQAYEVNRMITAWARSDLRRYKG